jgi:hypothetical protein
MPVSRSTDEVVEGDKDDDQNGRVSQIFSQ